MIFDPAKETLFETLFLDEKVANEFIQARLMKPNVSPTDQVAEVMNDPAVKVEYKYMTMVLFGRTVERNRLAQEVSKVFSS